MGGQDRALFFLERPVQRISPRVDARIPPRRLAAPLLHGDGGPDDFIHTQNFALIDKEKHIRGYYDGTNSEQMEQLVKDINLLLKEYKSR